MKKRIFIGLSIVLLILIHVTNVVFFSEKQLEISEMVPSRQSTIFVDDYLFYDHIKIYNPNKKSVYIGEYGISNSIDEPFKYKIMSGLWLGANEYFIIYFSSEYTGENWTVAKFDISEEQYIYLTNSEGKLISKIEVIK